MTCRNCAHFDIEHSKDKAGRVRQWLAKCLWVSTEPWPTSMSRIERRPQPGYVLPNDGKDCPCFKERT